MSTTTTTKTTKPAPSQPLSLPVPTVLSLADIHDTVEFSELPTGKFLYTFVTYIRDEAVYFGRLPVRKPDLTPALVTAALRPVPDNQLFPKYRPYAGTVLTAAPDVLTGRDVFVKRPRFSAFDLYREEDVFTLLPSLMVDEARAMERIARAPHPNIIGYHGCRVRRGRITGLVFDRHPCDLEAYLREGKTVEKERFMAALEAGVSHLHRIGYAHNDLNPSNVLVAEDGRPVIVDFGSAKRIGAKLTTSRGTPGWMEEGDAYLTSEKSHDLFALGKIRTWLDEQQIEAEYQSE